MRKRPMTMMSQICQWLTEIQKRREGSLEKIINVALNDFKLPEGHPNSSKLTVGNRRLEQESPFGVGATAPETTSCGHSWSHGTGGIIPGAHAQWEEKRTRREPCVTEKSPLGRKIQEMTTKGIDREVGEPADLRITTVQDKRVSRKWKWWQILQKT